MKYQFGYRSKRSTNLAATLLIDDIRREVDRGNLVRTVFVDLSKAFDTISHRTLLTKLQSYGVKSNELKKTLSLLGTGVNQSKFI